MITIQNQHITAQIDEVGAELKSAVCDGREYIYDGKSPYWAGSAPLMFPICSGLKDDTYYYEGKAYTLGKHGFARMSRFTVESQAADTATFLLTDSPETLAVYPFRFELRVNFSLSGREIRVTYRVTNPDTARPLYFSIGAHEAYACPEGIEEYEVRFPHPETLVSTQLEGNQLGYTTVPITENSDVLPLKESYFAVDALVFTDLKARSAVLHHRPTGREVRVDFDGFDYFLVWQKPGAPYICLEPWCGISDRTDTDQDFTHKEGLHRLAAGETFTRTHTITVL